MYAPPIQIRDLCRHGNPSDPVSSAREVSGSANVGRQILLISDEAARGVTCKAWLKLAFDRRSDLSAVTPSFSTQAGQQPCSKVAAV